MQQIHTLRAPPQLPEVLYSVLGATVCDTLIRCGARHIEEIHLQAARLSTVICGGKCFLTDLILTEEEMNDIFKRMCGFSLYAHRNTISKGYITLRGGIRVGVCGYAAMENQTVIGVNRISSLTVRIPHKVNVSIEELLPHLMDIPTQARSMLLYSPPGIGKTTLLAALTRTLSSRPYLINTAVIDTKDELGALLEGSGICLSVLSGFGRGLGMEIAIRNLGARLLVCDEIGNAEDTEAILSACNSGVTLLASAHAANEAELLERPVLKPLIEKRVFQTYVGISRTLDNRFVYHITESKNQNLRQGSPFL